jgi:hypothetical protein
MSALHMAAASLQARDEVDMDEEDEIQIVVDDDEVSTVEETEEVVVEDQEVEGEAPEGEAVEEFDTITLDGQPLAEDEDREAPEWAKKLRKDHRELAKKNRELERALAATTVAPAPPKLGPKPTMESCGWDTERLEFELDGWHTQKAQVEAHQRDLEHQQKAEQEAINAKLAAYEKGKRALRVPDYDEVESLVGATLSQDAKTVILKYADDPAKVVYAIGKNPELANRLSSIRDFGQLTKEVVRLEDKLMVSKTQKKPPAPERPAPKGGAASGGSDATLARLRAEADKTNDLTKVIAYKAKLKAAKK